MGGVSQHAMGRQPPGQTPLEADTPPLEQTLPLAKHCPWADTPLGDTPLPSGINPPAATAADSMHPTGMHFCYEGLLLN